MYLTLGAEAPLAHPIRARRLYCLPAAARRRLLLALNQSFAARIEPATLPSLPLDGKDRLGYIA